MGISREQALDCFRSDDLVGIGMEADAVRRRRHSNGVVGYAMQARIDCAVLAESPLRDRLEDAHAAIADAVDRGATGVRLIGCGDLMRTDTLLQEIRERFPELWIEGVALAELSSSASEAGVSLRDAIARLIDAGLNTIADDGMNLDCLGEARIVGWIGVHRTAHQLGIQTVAGFNFGAGETAQQRVGFLGAVRQLQEETGGFAAIAPKAAAAHNGRDLDGVTAVERLKTSAITRMFLDTIENVQACSTPEGLKVLQMGLRFGANDVGAVSPAAGYEEDVRRIIREAGFQPVQREMGYRAMAIG